MDTILFLHLNHKHNRLVTVSQQQTYTHVTVSQRKNKRSHTLSF